jgi:CYTH domain-containing protein
MRVYRQWVAFRVRAVTVRRDPHHLVHPSRWRGNTAVALEIERKFVLAEAPARRLLTGWDVTRIEQTYLAVDDPARVRVRRVDHDGIVTYFRTAKRKVGIAGVRDEFENEITRAEYRALKTLADPNRRTVRKKRYTFGFAGRVFELDHVREPAQVWLLEVELGTIDELTAPITLPPMLKIAAEVTGVRGWTNASIARAGLPAGVLAAR